jgi:hypothetical protein
VDYRPSEGLEEDPTIAGSVVRICARVASIGEELVTAASGEEVQQCSGRDLVAAVNTGGTSRRSQRVPLDRLGM